MTTSIQHTHTDVNGLPISAGRRVESAAIENGGGLGTVHELLTDPGWMTVEWDDIPGVTFDVQCEMTVLWSAGWYAR